MKSYASFAFAFLLLFPNAAAAQQTAQSGAVELLQRVLSQGGQSTANVYVGKLPPDLPSIPLPKARLVGSTASRYVSPAYGAPRVTIYYDADKDAISAYRNALTSAGWANKKTPMDLFSQGGFKPTNPSPQEYMYCRTPGPDLSVGISGANSRWLEIDVWNASTGIRSECSIQTPADLLNLVRSPVPELTAPQGEAMDVSAAGNPGGASGAYLTGSASIASLLRNFSGQYEQAGWRAGTVVQNPALASQTFSLIDSSGRHWQSVLTIYAVDGQPNAAIAFIDVTNLSNVPKQSQQQAIIMQP